MFLALAAYATYAINAAQFIYKLRLARLDAARTTALQDVEDLIQGVQA